MLFSLRRFCSDSKLATALAMVALLRQSARSDRNMNTIDADSLLFSLYHRALMSRKIRIKIPEAKRDYLEKKFAKEGRKRVGYTRFQVLDTTHPPGRVAANEYIQWYNDNKFDHMPEIEDVRETEVTDTSTVPKIGLKYPELCPKPALPLDEGSESEVEDESPISSTTEKESPPEEERSPSAAKDDDKGKVPHHSEDSEDESVAPSGRRSGGLIQGMTETMKRMGENLVGTGPSSRTSKKRKNATTEKPAPKPKKPSTRSSPCAHEPTDGASVNAGNDPPTKGSEAIAVTPARPAYVGSYKCLRLTV